MFRRITLLIPLLIILSMSGCIISHTVVAGMTTVTTVAARVTTTADHTCVSLSLRRARPLKPSLIHLPSKGAFGPPITAGTKHFAPSFSPSCGTLSANPPRNGQP